MVLNLKITNLLCNRLKNPLGFELETPRLSWIVECSQNIPLAYTRIEVSLNQSFTSLVYDSGEKTDIDNICFELPIKLKPRTRYFWRVTVAAADAIAAETAWFETAKLEEPWNAKWISPAEQPQRHPTIFTGFNIEKPVASARAYVCGLGLYELNLNSTKAGDEFLAPGLCAYDKWIPYQTYDITDLLTAGENSVEITLGNGWYKGRYGITPRRKFFYGYEFACICEIVLTFEDNTEQTIISDTSWKAKLCNIVDSSIFDGEVKDDTCENNTVLAVKEAGLATSLLEARRSPPTKIMHRIKPVSVIHTPAGETVLDMGQNMVGWLEFTCKAPRGEEVFLQFGEVLQGGNFYRDNLRTALCEYHYISDGTAKKIKPTFTFYGFRYVKLTQWHQEVDLADFTGLVLYSDMQPTGSIVTSNDKVNKLIENTLWGQRGNFLDVPTDCPQRDERMGWTGDAQVFFGTAAFNMDVAAFFSKYCYDLMREQQELGGNVPVVIPKHDVIQAGSCAWGDAATIIPWNHYIRYGDIAILKRQFPSMKGWVDYIRRHDEETGNTRLWKGDFHYCDWLALDGEDSIGNRFGGTQRTYLASCYYRYSSMLVAKAARVLGYTKEAEYYEELSSQVREAIINEYVTSTGRLAVTTQTAYILALYMDIIPEQYREQTAYALKLKLKESGYHLRTGFVGTPYLCRVLSATGSNNISYRLLLQEDFPSWLYEVNMGATTIWERWNSILPDGSISDTGMNSLNHYSYGSIVEWIYRDAAGIEPMEEYPGFRKFRLAPKPDSLLGSVKAEYESVSGKICSEWRYHQNGELELKFTVPYGTSAILVLPDHPDGPAEQELAAGEHSFRYLPASSCQLKINLDTPISQIYAHEDCAMVFAAELPQLANMMLFRMMAGERSIQDFINEGFLSLSGTQAQQLCEKLSIAAGCIA